MGSLYAVSQLLNDTPAGAMVLPRLTIKGQKVGGGPIPGNPHPLLLLDSV